MNRIELKELTKSQLKGHWKTPVLLTLAYLIVTIIASLFQEEAQSLPTIIITFVVVWAISVWATIGIPNFYLEFLKKDGKAGFKDVLVPSNKLLKALGYTVIIGIISMIIGFISVFASTGLIAASVFYGDGITIANIVGIILICLMYIAFIIFTFAVAQVPYIIIEKDDLGLLEAMSLSMKLMKGNKWKYFVLQLSFLGWGILSVITFGVGFLWLIPYMALAETNFYKDLAIENVTLD
ncbi:DUF975 family protein [[Clostridium] dakarense]|uniref:DUF975 family protein n=1 Tax=Faecalimicrobium dakarense TaxID=1301100 RepID=UPI0004ACB334|nr:DUF975 family protein [[Clostridium] dakarense]